MTLNRNRTSLFNPFTSSTNVGTKSSLVPRSGYDRQLANIVAIVVAVEAVETAASLGLAFALA